MALFETYDKKRERGTSEMLNSLNIQNLSDEEVKERLKTALNIYYDACETKYVEFKSYMGAYAAVELDLVIIKMLDELLSLLKEQRNTNP